MIPQVYSQQIQLAVKFLSCQFISRRLFVPIPLIVKRQGHGFFKGSSGLPFFAGAFFDVVSSGMIMMALPWLMLQQGGSGTLVALVALLCTLASFIATPIFATLIDRHPRKAILQWVQLLQAVTAFHCAVTSIGMVNGFTA